MSAIGSRQEESTEVQTGGRRAPPSAVPLSHRTRARHLARMSPPRVMVLAQASGRTPGVLDISSTSSVDRRHFRARERGRRRGTSSRSSRSIWVYTLDIAIFCTFATGSCICLAILTHTAIPYFLLSPLATARLPSLFRRCARAQAREVGRDGSSVFVQRRLLIFTTAIRCVRCVLRP